MKTRILALGTLLTCLLLPARADEEKPQAVFDFDFQTSNTGALTAPVLKAVEGGSPLRFNYQLSTTSGNVELGPDDRAYLKWFFESGSRRSNDFSLRFEEQNRTTRYVLKGELGSTDPQAALILQMDTAGPSWQGDSAHVVWKDDQAVVDGAMRWQPFEVTCNVAPGSTYGYLHIGISAPPSGTARPQGASYALRRLRLIEYGTPMPLKEPVAIAKPDVAVVAEEFPTFSLHTLRTRSGLSWFGIAAGAGLAGGLLGGGVLILFARWGERRRKARHEAELAKIASLDAVES